MQQRAQQNEVEQAPGERRADGKALRVLLAAPSLDILGGQSRQAIFLMEGLGAEPALDISFLPHNPRLPRGFRWLQRIKYVRTLVTTLAYLFLLVVRAPWCDILHTFSASYYSYLCTACPAILVAKLYGKKCILHYHSGEAEDHLRNWPRTTLPVMRLADEIVMCSGYLVDVFARFGLRARAIHNTVALDRFHFRERRPLRPVFLVSRLLEPLYNVACVLRAFKLIQERYPEARLTVAADGVLRPELERLAFDELRLRNTEFVGFVPFDQMPALYDAADIYLTATDLDNMPGSVIECMATGVLVVTTDAGGIPYIATHEETCLMIPRNDHAAMAAAAFRLLADEELAVGIARRARASSRRFTWEVVRDEWLKLYFEVAARAVRQTRLNDKGVTEA